MRESPNFCPAFDNSGLTRIAMLADVGIGFFLEPEFATMSLRDGLVLVPRGWRPTLRCLRMYYPRPKNLSAASRAIVGLARKFTAPSSG